MPGKELSRDIQDMREITVGRCPEGFECNGFETLTYDFEDRINVDVTFTKRLDRRAANGELCIRFIVYRCQVKNLADAVQAMADTIDAGRVSDDYISPRGEA